jgi:ATP-dependent Clp protease ATP-binding subunit ClpA
LLLGPTGSGKTHVVESMAQYLFGQRKAVVKVDCAEFQHSHEIAKLIGSPPGYLGHRETQPMLSQTNVDRYRTEEHPFSLVLFDEIEKASDALWQLLLGIMDKGVLKCGDGTQTDFGQCLIFMTSNLGAKDMQKAIAGGIGFPTGATQKDQNRDSDQTIYRAASAAAKKNFTPEFMNRIDKVVVFRSLTDDHLKQILELELAEVTARIYRTISANLHFTVSPAAKEFLLAEGKDPQYGARHLKRALNRFLVPAISRLVASKQLTMRDHLVVDLEDGKLVFDRLRGEDESPVSPTAGEAQHWRDFGKDFELVKPTDLECVTKPLNS